MTAIRTHRGMFAFGMLLWAAILVFPLSACTRQEGRTIPEAAVNTLKVGKSTEKDVLQKLGPPETKKKILGEEVWIYRHVVSEGFASMDTDIHMLRLRFDNQGILQNIDEKTRKYKRRF